MTYNTKTESIDQRNTIKDLAILFFISFAFNIIFNPMATDSSVIKLPIVIISIV